MNPEKKIVELHMLAVVESHTQTPHVCESKISAHQTCNRAICHLAFLLAKSGTHYSASAALALACLAAQEASSKALSNPCRLGSPCRQSLALQRDHTHEPWTCIWVDFHYAALQADLDLWPAWQHRHLQGREAPAVTWACMNALPVWLLVPKRSPFLAWTKAYAYKVCYAGTASVMSAQQCRQQF